MKTRNAFANIVLLVSTMLLLSSYDRLVALDYPMLKPPKEPVVEKEKVEKPIVPAGSLLDRAVDPKLYIIGPGDVFIINLYGVTEEPIMSEVLPEGVISVAGVGEIPVAQLTLEKAKQEIMSALMSRYRDRTIAVSLAKVRSFKVSVTGAVEKPGIVAVSASDRVSEAIALAGGLQRKGSHRNVKLVNVGKDTLITDLDFFNSTGSLDANPYLHEGQLIFVPVVSDSFNKVEVYGAVNAPGVFEYKKGDRLTDLIDLGFGPSVDADLSDGELVRFLDDRGSRATLKVDLPTALADRGSGANLLLQPDDRLFVRCLAGFKLKEQVTIVGEVKYPGVYPVQEGIQTVSQLVAKAGGLLEGASLSEAEMFRSEVSGSIESKTSFDQLLQLSTDKLSDFEIQYLKETSLRKPGKVALDFEALFTYGKMVNDAPLKNGDRIIIPRKSYAVTVLGRVVNPGLVPYKESETVNYYIRLAGGLGYKADKGDIRLIKANTGSVVGPTQKTPVSMGDRIMVPQRKGTDYWKFVRDVGLFLANLATVYVVVNQVTK